MLGPKITISMEFADGEIDLPGLLIFALWLSMANGRIMLGVMRAMQV